MESRRHVDLTSMRTNRALTAAALVAILLGIAAALAGSIRIADMVWGGAVIAALVPVSVSIVRALRQGRIGVDIIALLALAGALLLGEYLAGAVIALMFSGGRALEEFAESRARRELSSLLARAPRTVQRYEDDTLVSVPIEQVRPDDKLLVKPGEVVPVDGVLCGTAVLDESALTGESRPVERKVGEGVRSGVLNTASCPLELRATATAQESTYAAIVRLVAQAQASKAPLARLADRYALVFLSLTLFVAALAWIISGDPVRALAVLVIATPCPLILAAPVAIVSGISRAARRAIIIKNGAALENLARAKILVLDKTGTVTVGAPVISAVASFGFLEQSDILRFAASLDQVSPHVLARATLKSAADNRLVLATPADVHEEPGSGIRGKVEGHEVALGKSDWVLQGAAPPPWLRRLRKRTLAEGSSAVLVAVDGKPAGALIVEDPIRSDARSMIRSLRNEGFSRIVLLTGDHATIGNAVGGVLGVDQVLAECSPEQKVAAVKSASARNITVMVGDGINDAPALAAAHVGIAMGSRGATAASEAADIVLLVDRIDRLVEATRIARHSRAIAIQSILAGMALSILGMGFAAWGLLSPLAGAILQEFIDVIAVANALRALRGPGGKNLDTSRHAGVLNSIRADHQRLMPGVKRIRIVADRLDHLSAARLRIELAKLHSFLTQEVLPHDEAEEKSLYPIVSRLIGGDDPTATMARAHTEIARLTNILGSFLDEMGAENFTEEDRRELRAVLYGLDAILRLHFSQEEESYLALIDTETDTKPMAGRGAE